SQRYHFNRLSEHRTFFTLAFLDRCKCRWGSGRTWYVNALSSIGLSLLTFGALLVFTLVAGFMRPQTTESILTILHGSVRRKFVPDAFVHHNTNHSDVLYRHNIFVEINKGHTTHRRAVQAIIQ